MDTEYDTDEDKGTEDADKENVEYLDLAKEFPTPDMSPAEIDHVIELSSDSEEEQPESTPKHDKNTNVPEAQSRRQEPVSKTLPLTLVCFHLESLRFSTREPELHLTQVKH